MNIELNSIVNVKLTSEGKAVLYTYYYKELRYTHHDWESELKTKKDSEGIYSFTFEEFIQIFGKAIVDTLDNCFESIEIFPQKNNVRTKK